MLMPVPVAKIVKKTLPIYLAYSARTESIGNVTLQSKVSGYLKEQLAPDGGDVKQGDLLYKIDPRDFQASLDQASAQAERGTPLRSTTCAPISIAAPNSPRPAFSPKTLSTNAAAACVRPKRLCRWIKPRSAALS